MERKAYGQLGLTERIEIYRLHADGKSRRFIARALGRNASTISRELKRNGKPCRNRPQGGYEPERAEKLAARRHARGRSYKLERQPELRKLVMDQLAMERSPEQIAGRLTLEQGRPVISHESIYRYIYWRSWSFNEKLHLLLPRRKCRRGWRRTHPRWSKDAIFQRVPIHLRPPAVNARKHAGHWEADLMAFSNAGQNLLVMHERTSRLTLVRRHDSRVARDTAEGISALIGTLGPSTCKSITFDNGPEFAAHHLLKKKHRIKTWFCDTHSPWQKGGVENAIGRLRRPLPRKTDLEKLSRTDIEKCVERYNNTPRKCLGFKTPYEVFLHKVLHFKRESTPSLRSG